MKKYSLGLVAFLLFVLGCLTTAPKVVFSSGETELVECEKASNCYQKIGEVCPKGYSVMDKNQDLGAIDGHEYTVTTMLVECK